jgi:hypothetical protein
MELIEKEKGVFERSQELRMLKNLSQALQLE